MQKKILIFFTIALTMCFVFASFALKGDQKNKSESFLFVPKLGKVQIHINVADTIEPVNRRVMGLCMIYMPFGEKYADSWKGILDGTSAHLWGACRWKSPPVTAAKSLMNVMPFVKKMNIKDIYYMLPDGNINRKARYISTTDNNLDKKHQPSTRAELLRFLNKSAHPGFPNGFGINRFRAWDEPQFPQNGGWPAEDFARYLVDLSKAIKKVDPNVQLGAGVHENNMEWNTKMLKKLAELDVEAIRFIEPHPFSFAWLKARRKIDEYYARIAESEVLRPKIREKIKLINKISHGNWRLDACAWNIHPPGWTPPYYVSTDMAVGVHVASMFGMFWEEGVHAAQFFQFASRKDKDSHFYIVKNTAKGLKLLPSGEVFKLYGKYFRGNRIRTKINSPYFVYKKNIFIIKKKIKKDLKIPLVIAHTAYDSKNKQLVIIVTNKHKTSKGHVNIKLTRFTPSSKKAELLTISAKSPTSTIPITEKKQLTLPFGSDPNISITCSPHSVSALIIKGEINSEGGERLKGKKYIKNWTVKKIQKKSEKSNNKFFFPDYTCDSTGFVNLARILERSGLAGKIADVYEGTCVAWIFSPEKRKVKINVGFVDKAIVRFNGEKIYSSDSSKKKQMLANEFNGTIKMNSGWNKIQLEVLSGETGMGFWCTVENKIDLIFKTGKNKPKWPRKWLQIANSCAYINNDVNSEKCFTGYKLHLASTPNLLRRAFILWNLNNIPKNLANKIKAKVIFHPAWTRGKGDVWLEKVSQKWNINTLNYKTMPKSGSSIAKLNVDENPWIFKGKDIDRTVQEWIINPKNNFGVSVNTNISYHCGFFGINLKDKDINKTAVIEFKINK